MAFARTGNFRSAATQIISGLSRTITGEDWLPGQRGPVLSVPPRRRGWFLPYLAAVLSALLVPVVSWAGPSPGVVFNGVVTTLSTGGISLTNPAGVAVDASGNVYIADTINNQIVKVTPAGVSSVLTTTGLSPALSLPIGLAIDGSGNLYIADSGNSRVVKVAGGIGTVVDMGSVVLSSSVGIAVDASGNLYVADTGDNQIVEIPAGGSAAVLSISGLGTALNIPSGLAVDAAGNLYIADSGNNRIVTVTAGGAGSALSITGLSTPLDTPRGVAVDGLGTIYIADTNNGRIVMVTPAGAGSVLSTGSLTLISPIGVAVDFSSAVSVADTNHNRIVQIMASAVNLGEVHFGTAPATTLTLPFTVGMCDTLGSLSALTLGTPNLDFTIGSGTTCASGTTDATCTVDIQFLPSAAGLRRGALVLFDQSQNPLITIPLFGTGDAPLAALAPGPATKVNTGGVSTILPFQVAFDGAGNMYVGDYNGSNVVKVVAGGGSASVVAITGLTLDLVTGVALDGAGNLFIADHDNSRIVEVTAAGVASVLSISGLGTALNHPTALAFDSAGNLYIADWANNRVVKVTPAGAGSVLGTGSFVISADGDTGVAVDAAGTVYLVDRNNSRVIKVTAAGAASLVIPAGISPVLSDPQGVAVDGMGNVYIADSGNNRIVEITTAGVASVLTFPGLTAPSTLGAPFGVSIDPLGNVFVPDWINNRVVKLDVSTASLNFASTKVGLASAAKTATVTNLGNQPLAFSADPTYTPDFSQNSGDTNPCISTTSLAAGAVCDVSVKFTPQSIAALSANIVVTNNTLNFSNETEIVAVSGTGLSPADTTAVAVTKNPTTATIGQPLTVTATVTDTTAGHTSTIPTGSATFTDTLGSTVVPLNNGDPVTLDGTGKAILTGVTLSGAGSHTLTANYAGVNNVFLTSLNTTALTVSKDAAVITGPTTQPFQVIANQAGSVPFTVTGPYSVVPVPTGSLSYNILDSSSASVASGTATLTTGSTSSTTMVPTPSSLASGSYTVSVTYPGDANYDASSSPTASVSLIVNDFSLNVSTGGATANTVLAGGTAIYPLVIGPTSGTTFPAAVSFTVTGLPTGATATITPSTLPASAGVTNVTLTIQVPVQTASLHRNDLFALALSPLALGLLLLPFGGMIRRAAGKRAQPVCLLLLVFAGTLLLALAGCGTTSSGYFGQKQQSYTLTFTATSGTLSHSTLLTLTVQ
jgi:sugar lactone lactonase YvrE